MIKTLRISGGDYSTYAEAVTGLLALFTAGLTDNITLNIQGGQTFTSSGASFSTIATNWNGFSLTVQTDPTEQATPATINGPVGALGKNGTALVTNLIIYSTATLTDFRGIGPGSGIVAKVENCYLVKGNCAIWATIANSQETAGSIFNNNTIVLSILTGSPNQAITNLVASGGTYYPAFHNNLFVCYSSASGHTYSIQSNTTTNKNNTLKNYGTATATFGGTATWVNSDVTNASPNTIDILITAYNEAAATIITRNAALASASGTCSANADPATAAATDITGKSRF